MLLQNRHDAMQHLTGFYLMQVALAAPGAVAAVGPQMHIDNLAQTCSLSLHIIQLCSKAVHAFERARDAASLCGKLRAWNIHSV